MELCTVTVDNTGMEMLIRPFVYKGITVPIGFTFDGASTPRIFWSIIPPYKKTKKAACVHDWLCIHAKNKKDRLKADKIFYGMLKEAGLSRYRCILGYIGVRIGALIGVGVYNY